MQKLNASKNADIKIPTDNLPIAERSQLQQAPIVQNGGGGTRAAWRIQILITTL